MLINNNFYFSTINTGLLDKVMVSFPSEINFVSYLV